VAPNSFSMTERLRCRSRSSAPSPRVDRTPPWASRGFPHRIRTEALHVAQPLGQIEHHALRRPLGDLEALCGFVALDERNSLLLHCNAALPQCDTSQGDRQHQAVARLAIR